MTTLTHIYEMESASKELMESGKYLVNLAMKDVMSLEHLSDIDDNEIKAFREFNTIIKTCDKLIDSYFETLKEMNKQMCEMENTLNKINEKLDRIESAK